MSKVLVTGGAGMIGSVLVPRLLSDGYCVHVLDNFMYKQKSLLGVASNVNLALDRADVTDSQWMKKFLYNNAFDFIIPLAAIVGAPLCDRDPLRTKATNLEAIELIGRESDASIIYPNSNSGYGTSKEVCTEETPINPLSFYAYTKYMAEKSLMARGNAITLRLATVFGVSPRMRLDLLVNDFIYRALTDKYLLFFEPNAMRNYIHVLDLVDCFVMCIEGFSFLQNNVYNVGNDSLNMSKVDLCRAIQESVLDFKFSESGSNADPDKRDYRVSSEKLIKHSKLIKHFHGIFAPYRNISMAVAEMRKALPMLSLKESYGNV